MMMMMMIKEKIWLNLKVSHQDEKIGLQVLAIILNRMV